MKSALSLNLRSYWAGLKAVLVCTLAVIVYTALMTGIGALGFPEQANGSMITNSEGQIVGSSLIGQSFSDADGEAIDKYFQPRPSAAGDGYDAAASSGANKGHSDEEYLKTIEERRDAIAEREGVDVKQVPADAAHISPEYTAIQVERVAEARSMDVEDVERLVKEHTTGRGLGFIGEPVVNVVPLNLALDDME